MDPLILFLVSLASFGVALVYPNIGLGGGVLHVPILMYIAGFDKNSAVPISLSLVLAGAIAALPRHYKSGMVDLRLGAYMACGAVIGATCGALINLALSQELFEWLFALTMVLICARMTFDVIKGRDEDTNDDSKMCMSRFAPAIALSVMAGVLGSTFGIGGGLVYVPVMIYLLCRKTKLAAGTSTLIIVPTAIVGLLTYYIGGASTFHPDALSYVTVLIPVVLAGSFLGSKIFVEKLTGKHVKTLFIALALFVAFTMIIRLLI
jgi:uncharacterized membrane protein YfcA